MRARLLPREGSVWLLGVLALFCMVPEGAVLDWAALYLRQELGAEVARSGLAFAFFSGAMAVMRFAGDGVRNRFGAVTTLRWSGLIASVGLMGAALAPGEGAGAGGLLRRRAWGGQHDADHVLGRWQPAGTVARARASRRCR